MSLNGLDNPKVGAAYVAAVGEPGGWFLLKYASRDEVEVLGTGNGGIIEMRKTIAEYDETNPLYGFLKYRRRNVLIKYLPEDCSRLIQARVAVHFNAVSERFSPYDSQFDMTAPDDLRDSRLSAACSLHAATGSNSSSGSLRRKHLMEIAEEDEEDQQQPAKRQSLIKDGEKKAAAAADADRPQTATEPVTLNAELAASPENTKFSAPTTSEVPTFTGADDFSTADTGRRLSSQSSRPEVYSSYSSYTYKPKVKLGPRPSLETSARPQTAGNFRPVSSIPAGFKLFGKGAPGGGSTSTSKKSSSSSGRKDSVGSGNTEISFAATTATLAIPEEHFVKTQLESARPATSSGVSTKSGMTMSSRTAMTPEKARLKKAMQLREKKKKKAASNTPPVPAVPATTTNGDTTGEEESHDKTSEKTDDAEEIQQKTEEEAVEKRIPMVKADSGIAIDASPASTKGGDVLSDRTQSDSQPASPVMASSEAEQSTKASSVSESTEQTVEAPESKADEQVSSNGSTPKPTIADQDQKSASTVEATQEGRDETSASTREEPEAPAEQKEPVAMPVPDIPALTAPDSMPSSEDNKPETREIPEIQTDAPATTTDNNENLSEARGSDNAQANTTPDTPSVTTTERKTAEDNPQITPSAAAAAPAAAAPTTDCSDEKKRRKAVEPIRTDLAAAHRRPTSQSDLNFSDNESLLEELQSATVQEAKPMLVSKTPRTPNFPGHHHQNHQNHHHLPPAMSSSPSRSPVAGGGGGPAKPHVVRTVSNPVRGNLVAPPSDVSQSSARSLSQGAAYLHHITQQRNADAAAAANLAKRTNMGSGISQRIKALEMLSASSAEASAGSAPPAGSRPSSTFFSVKKDRVPSRSPSVADRANSLSRDARPLTAQSTRESSPETLRLDRDRSGSISSRLSMFEPAGGSPGGGGGGGAPRGRPETISVTAKIIRSPTSQSRNRGASDQPLELKQSPLLVDHQHGGTTPATPEVIEPQAEDRRTSDLGDTSSRRSSFSIVRDFIKEGRKSLSSPSTDNLTFGNPGRSPTHPAPAHQNSSSSSLTGRLNRLSLSGSSKDKDRDGMSILSDDGDDAKSSASDKRKSRAGRFMRRLSSLSGSSRSKISSPPGGTPTVTEEKFPDTLPPTTTSTTTTTTTTTTTPATSEGPGIAAYMGDVNVQFPDTLLWKRRNMYLDTQGFVVLSALPQTSQGQQQQRTTGVKRYHLGDFRTPYAPDVEVQELPNSVVLDLMEGSAVQVACEDRAGQMNVLQILRDAHAAYAGQ
ncbi:hypothetical protein ACRE_052730 [Hapsidospora chrysogenum ATCC 11550]|uniref:ADF-H domain-containing protein n=1 Tax=Hapsidospora chrysogenum (strain ATCC 11550 / CBS 779.69 / DSM 880 / IAM 14645 / JCM 23072 / IMI 49137) TaxID=857340 RepID=A0A086T3M6_HAPC1|nr:hypothetical protein ACRE_052730 [Hapsidospora chrysogenum ATCC 11550]